MSIPSTIASIPSILAALLLSVTVHAMEPGKPLNQLRMRMKKATLRITYASQKEAETAGVKIAPLPGNKSWAFTTRWDDNNTRHRIMHDLMAKHGYRGGFYLNSGRGSDKQVELAQDLVKDGCGIGAHSMTHPMLTTLNLNEIFWEILACKVEREADTDLPIVCYGFSYCNFRDSSYPDVHRQIAESFIRSGIHHVVNPGFMKPDQGVLPETFSVSRFMVPGDRNPLPDKFDQCLERIVKDTAYQQRNPLVTIAFHTWHTYEGFANLEKSLIKHKGNPDWWYCDPNEYAAYRYRYHNTSIAQTSVDKNNVTYEISTPVDGDVGRAVPLSLILGGEAEKTKVDGEDAPIEKTASGGLLNVFAKPDGSMPERIDMVANPDNVEFSDRTTMRFSTFEDILFHLRYDPKTNTAILTASNKSNIPVTNTHVTLRLPPMFENGIIPVDLRELPPSKQIATTIELPAVTSDVEARDGAPFLVAQVDFTRDGHVGRVHATCRGKRTDGLLTHSRDAAMVLGPFGENDAEKLVKLSAPEQSLPTADGDHPTTGWYPVPEKEKRTKSDCIILRFPRSHKDLLKPLAESGESGNVAFAFSFIPPEDTQNVTLSWPGWGRGKENRIKQIYLNGKEHPATLRDLPVRPGKANRLIVIPNVTAQSLSKSELRLPGIRLTPEVEWRKVQL